jgi:hypothetical protein
MKLVMKYQISAINICWENRNLIFCHKFHIGIPFCGKRFLTRQIPTSCLPTWLALYTLNIYAGYHKWALAHSSFCLWSRNLTGQKTLPTKWGTYMKLVMKYQISAINICWEKCDEKWAYMFNVYKNQQSPQTGSRNLMGPKPVFGPVRFLLPVCRLSWFLYTLNIYAHFSSHFSQQLLLTQIWYLVTSFILVPHIVGNGFGPIRFLLEKCAYMLNVYKSQLSRQTGSRNLTGQKTLPTKWGTYMKLVMKYQISAIYFIIIPPLHGGGGGYTVLPLSVHPRYFSSHFSR